MHNFVRRRKGIKKRINALTTLAASLYTHTHTFFFGESATRGTEETVELSILADLQDQVHVVVVLKVVKELQNGWVLQPALYLHLVPHPSHHTPCLHQLLVNLGREKSKVSENVGIMC